MPPLAVTAVSLPVSEPTVGSAASGAASHVCQTTSALAGSTAETIVPGIPDRLATQKIILSSMTGGSMNSPPTSMFICGTIWPSEICST